MAAPKKFQELRREAVGVVRVIELVCISTKRKYYRTECRRKNVTPKTKSFPNWKEAYQFATKLNLSIETGRIKETDDETLFELKKLSEKINQTKVLEVDSVYSKVNLDLVFDSGIKLLKSLEKINAQRQEAKLPKFSVEWALSDWEFQIQRQLKVATAPKLETLIKRLLTKKLSRTGGRGNRELEDKTKREWKYTLEKINRWIGDCSTLEEPKTLKVRVINGINSGVNEAGRNKGEFWSPMTKNRFASKANEFGKWLVDEEQWDKNAFRTLPKEFAVAGNPRAVTFSADEVEKLFAAAMKKENQILIPYMAFLFFSGARPYEIAAEDKNRRFSFEDMLGWQHTSTVTGGVLFEICVFDKKGNRKSKGSRDRYADLVPAGVEWLQWYFKNKGEELPNTGQIEYSRRIFDRIKKEALDYYWPQDGPRHTFTSLAHRNENFKTNNANYWIEKCGHRYEIFQQKYNAPKTPEECDQYFKITPALILKKFF